MIDPANRSSGTDFLFFFQVSFGVLRADGMAGWFIIL